MMAEKADVHSPVDGHVVGQTVHATAQEASAHVERLRRSQPQWEAAGPRERARWLFRYRDWLLDHQDEINRLLQEESGKPWPEANLELPYVVDVINYYAKNAELFLADERPRRHSALTLTKNQRVLRRAYPVVGVITPWNFPLGLSLIDAVPALLAGAAVVVKPSEFAPLGVTKAIAGWAEVGAPAVFSCVNGGPTVGETILDSVDFVQFTGSVATGKVIAHAAAERLIPCGLELGGKDAMIVLDDADLDRAANAAVWGGIANAGQMCTSIERIYADESVFDKFVLMVCDRVSDLSVGAPGTSRDYEVGPLATEAQVEIVDRHVADAVEKGAKILVGGQRHGRFFDPTVLINVDHSMQCMTVESFGPTLPIMKVADEDEAVRLANDSSYGLSATVFGRDTDRAERVARSLEVGAVNINDVFGNLFTLPVPQSGWKQSGLGARNGGAHGILKYTRSQGIVGARVAMPREPNWYPYTPTRTAVLRRVARLIGAGDLRRKLT